MNMVVVVAGVVAALVILGIIGYFLQPLKDDIGATRLVNLDAAWDHYMAQPPEGSARDRQAVARLKGGGESSAARVKGALGPVVDAALSGEDPQAALRQAIMDATDRFVMGETILEGDAEPDDDTVQAVAEAGVLRTLGKLRFGDHAPDDWYSHYLTVAQMNSKNVAGMLRGAVDGEGGGLEESLHEPLAGSIRQVREALLHYPPRTPVKRGDQLTADETLDAYPSQVQIDRLTNVMNDRFEKLFAGQVYQIRGGPAVNPAEAFQVDAGLLYTLLAQRFRHPTDAWRKIMEKAMGQYRSVLESEEKLLERARGLHRVWVDGKDDGPLNAVLRDASVEALPGSAPDEADALAGGMAEDAAILVGAIQEIVSEG